jgi:hypothetical protein
MTQDEKKLLDWTPEDDFLTWLGSLSDEQFEALVTQESISWCGYLQ